MQEGFLSYVGLGILSCNNLELIISEAVGFLT
jgi:hypothetical protein